MNINTILSPERTFASMPGSSRKRVLEKISCSIADQLPGIEADDIFDALIQREKLGSTGLGHGIAIPHCRLEHCPGVIGTLVKLNEAVDFEASDELPVDLLFVLIVPSDANDQHLETLAELARLFSQPSFCEGLRNAKTNEELFQTATAYANAA